MRKYVWLLAGGGVIAFLALRKKPERVVDIDALMQEAHKDQRFNQMIADLARTGGLTEGQARATRTGPLRVMLDLKVSGFEKVFAGDITDDARKAAVKIARLLREACTGAPLLSDTNPSVVRVSDIKAGFRVLLVWPAVWRSSTTGPVRPTVRDCIERLLNSVDKDFGERLIRLTAERVA